MRTEDELSNAIMVKLRELNIISSVIHTELCDSAFILDENQNWIIGQPSLGKYKGYLRNVAVNKVLLLNEIKPFVLSDSEMFTIKLDKLFFEISYG